MTSFQVVLVKPGKEFDWCCQGSGDFRDFLEEKIGIPISVPKEEIDRHDPKFVKLVSKGGYEVDHLKIVTISDPKYCILHDSKGNEIIAYKNKTNWKDARTRTRFVTIIQQIDRCSPGMR